MLEQEHSMESCMKCGPHGCTCGETVSTENELQSTDTEKNEQWVQKKEADLVIAEKHKQAMIEARKALADLVQKHGGSTNEGHRKAREEDPEEYKRIAGEIKQNAADGLVALGVRQPGDRMGPGVSIELQNAVASTKKEIEKARAELEDEDGAI